MDTTPIGANDADALRDEALDREATRAIVTIPSFSCAGRDEDRAAPAPT